MLAVDSATRVAGVALVAEDRVIREAFVNFRRNHSEILMPLIAAVLQESQCQWGQIAALAVTAGPGSFTGLRIGMATVKGLASATGLPIAAIPTPDVVAHNLAGSKAIAAVLLDARRQEVYFSCYDVQERYPKSLLPITACSPEQAGEKIMALLDKTGRKQVIMLGDGVAPYADYFTARLGERLLTVSPHMRLPRAAALGSLAWQAFSMGKVEHAGTVAPLYIRLSEAEMRLGQGGVSG